MPFKRYRPGNNATGTPLGALSGVTTTLIANAGEGDRFPSVFPYLLTIEEREAVSPFAVLKREMVEVTNRVGDTFTIVRGAGNCLPSDASMTQGNASFSFSNPANTSFTLAVNAETIADIHEEMTKKLPIIGGLGEDYGVNKVKEIDPLTGDEVLRNLSVGTTIGNTELIRSIDPTTREVKETPYFQVKNELGGAGKYIQTVLLGEDISGTTPTAMAVVSGAILFTNTLGSNVSGNRIKSGIRFSVPYNTTLGVVKTSQVSTSTGARVQLFQDNGTTLVAEQTPSSSDTVTFPNTPLVANTIYRLVLNDNSNFNNTSNELAFASYQTGFRYAISGTLNGVNTVEPQNIKEVQLGTQKAMKAVANSTAEYALFAGFVTGPKVKGDIVELNDNDGTLVGGFNGLTKGAYYFIGNSPGIISTIPISGLITGQHIFKVGEAKSSSEILMGTKRNNRFQSQTYGVTVYGNSTSPLTTYLIPVNSFTRVIAGIISGTGSVNANIFVYFSIDGVNIIDTIYEGACNLNSGPSFIILDDNFNFNKGFLIIKTRVTYTSSYGYCILGAYLLV